MYEQPRALLTRLLGRSPLELPSLRERALCSGAGGLLPLTMPAVARSITEELVEQMRATGAQRIVTGCGGTQKALEALGVEALTLDGLVLRAFQDT